MYFISIDTIFISSYLKFFDIIYNYGIKCIQSSRKKCVQRYEHFTDYIHNNYVECIHLK